MTGKERVEATVRGQKKDRVAVTPLFMRWAASFYGVSFRDYYLNGEVLAAAQIAVARELGTDHVTCMGEPWAEADSYGMRFDYPEDGVGIPREMFLKEAGDEKKLLRLDPRTMPRLKERLKCIARLVKEAGREKCVVGWVEGPIAEYSDLRGMQETMLDLVDNPAMFNGACEVIVENAIQFGCAQAKLGADVVGVGDAAASLVGPQIYEELVLPWEQKLIAGLHDAGVMVKLHVCGNIAKILPLMKQSGADIIDVDWMVPLREARRMVGENVTLAGNFDPSGVLLSGSAKRVEEAAQRCIEEGGQRFILQPGCEVPPGTSIENLRAFCPKKGN